MDLVEGKIPVEQLIVSKTLRGSYVNPTARMLLPLNANETPALHRTSTIARYMYITRIQKRSKVRE
jgi:hypothetical protein